MAREIVVSRDGKTSTFGLTKVDRSKLYGHRRRIHLGPDGAVCTRAALTEDGALLIQSGMLAQGYFTGGGTWVPNKELVGLDEEGKPVEQVDSTLGKEQSLEGPVDAQEILDLELQSVYALDPTELDDGLRDALNAGDTFRFVFSYRADYRAETAFLVANPEGELFALIGRPSEVAWRDAEEMISTFEDSDDDDDGDLDFEMF